MTETRSYRGDAVVIGGSTAAMVSARVLSEHFDRVTLLERDTYPCGPATRAGLPQARHTHVLLEAGRRVLERWFPKLVPELVAAGAEEYDGIADFEWISPAGVNPRYPSDIRMLGATRDLIDWGIREQLRQDTRIHMQTAKVTGLQLDSAKSQVIGVTTAQSPSGQPAEHIAADFVVDATGRGSNMPRWLEAHGYPQPEEVVVNAFLGYASRLVQPGDVRRNWKTFYIQCAPPYRNRGGVISPVENGNWIVTLVGGGKDYPPTEEAAFNEFAKSLPDPRFAEAYASAEPLSPIAGSRSTENRLRRYDTLQRFPNHLVVLGDAACAFNPVYGQGMSSAAVAASLLNDCLHSARTTKSRSLATRFQARLAKANARPWMLATGEDYRYREVDGPAPPFASRMSHSYLDRVTELATRFPHVHLKMVEVLHLIRPPISLFTPPMLARVLRSTLIR